MKNRKWWIRGMAAATVICLTLTVCGLTGTCQSLRDSVVRLHVLAASDSDTDQALKLQVRDAILARSAAWLAPGDSDRDTALDILRQHLPDLEAVARETLTAAGCDDPVAVSLEKAYFTARDYGEYTLPAGIYDAVRVVIGAGAGHNWWCVVYPPLCVGAAGEAAFRRSLTPAQSGIVTGNGRFILRFKVVEWFSRLFGR